MSKNSFNQSFLHAGLLLVGLALVSVLVGGCGQPQTPQPAPTSAKPPEAATSPSPESTPRASGTESLPAPGGSWEPLSEMPTDLVALAVDPANAKLLYASTYPKGSEGGGLYRTEDGGLSWERVAGNEIGSPASRIDALALDGGTPPTLYAAAGSAVLASTDGAQTWSPRGSTGLEWSSTWQLWIAPSDREVLTIRTQVEDTAPLVRSVDGGRSWTRVDEGVPGRIISLALHPTDAGVLYAGTPNGVFKTTDGGRTWAPASKGIEGDLSVKALAIDPTDPDTVYAGGDPGLVKSTDGGRHWTSLEPGPCPGEFCCHSEAIVPDPATSGRVYMLCSGAPALATSDDGGANWRVLGSGEPERWVVTVCEASLAPDLVFVCSEKDTGGWRYGLAPLAAGESRPATAQAIGTPHAAGASASYRPGDLIDSDGLVVSVLGWSWAAEAAGHATPEPGLKYVVVDVVAYNTGRGDREINPYLQYTLRDADGQTYEYGGSRSATWSAALRPGELRREAPFFEVPEAAHGFSFIFRPDWMAEGYAYVELGDQPLTLELPEALRVSQPNSYALGDAVEYGDLSFAMTGWQVTAAQGQVTPVPGTKLVAVDVVLANRSEQELTLQMTDLVRLLDSNAIAYKPLEGIMPIPASRSYSITPRRGEVLRARVLFQIPEESHGYTLVYRGGSLAPSAYVELGAEPQVVAVPAELAALEGPTYDAGQVVDSGDLTFAVLGWELSEIQETAEGEPGEQLLFVNLLVVNRGTTQEGRRLNATLRDAGFWQYERIDTYIDWWSREAWPAKLSQGELTRGTVVFQVQPGGAGYVFGVPAVSETRDMAFVRLGAEPFRGGVPAGLVAPSPYALGETIRQGGAELTVLSWKPSGGDPECPKPGEPASAAPTAVSLSDRPVCPIEGYRFLVVELTVANRGSQPTESAGAFGAPTIRDATGYHYKVDQNYYVKGGESGPQEFGGIEPGEERRGTFVYEVPLDSSGYAFVFDPTWLFGGGAGELIAVDLGQ